MEPPENNKNTTPNCNPNGVTILKWFHKKEDQIGECVKEESQYKENPLLVQENEAKQTQNLEENRENLGNEGSQSKENMGEEEGENRRSKRTAAINQRLLMKKIASHEPNIEDMSQDELKYSDKGVLKKKRMKRENQQLYTSSSDHEEFIRSVSATYAANQQFFGLQWQPQPYFNPQLGFVQQRSLSETSAASYIKYNNSYSLENYVNKPTQEQLEHEEMIMNQLNELKGAEVFNFNEYEYLASKQKKKKKIMINKEHIFIKGLNYIENYFIQNRESLLRKDISELRKLGLDNVQVDPVFLIELGGNYEQFKDEIKDINKLINSLQSKLNELYSEMGKSIPNKINEPSVFSCSSLSPTSSRDKDKHILKFEEILEEMKDFQDLVNDEHKEKRKIYKNLVTNTSKYIIKMEQDLEKNKTERNKQVLLIYRNLSNSIDLFWKKIEKFAWEHLKKDLQQELIKKKKQNLDKFIQDAIKVSINDQDRYILDKKIKTVTTQPQTTQNINHSEPQNHIPKPKNKNQQDKVGSPKPNVSNDEDQVEDEYVLNKDEERMELDDLKLEDEMDSDKEENELNDLQKEAEMPLEELLKMYQNQTDEQSEEPDYDEIEQVTDSDEAQASDRDEAEKVSDSEADRVSELSMSDDPQSPNSDRYESSKPNVSNDEDQVEDEYVLNKDEERMELDDLKLEDEMDSDKEENELNDLQKEAEMPLEELLKMYQNQSDEADVPVPKKKYKYKKDDSNKVEIKTNKTQKDEESSKSKMEKVLTEEQNNRVQVNQEEDDVDIEVPFLIKGVLRPYQKEGLRWLVSLYERNINGILADEMGLGKTLQTICLLAYLACNKGNWGPHIIIVPTSILLNWVMEFNKFCPGFKVLAYYGTPAERAKKRTGWNKPYSFNVLISSYTIVVQDSYILKRRAWEYMILDEAQNIKNFTSKRWQTLLTFNTKFRLLLTGTPLQNSLQELWSLMHFILPNIFTSHTQFNIWFTDPLNQALDNMYSNNPLFTDNELEKKNKEREEMNKNNMELVEKLHAIFRPYLLRRLKKDVEKQMPSKYEHVLKCTLTKRQQVLYDEYIHLYNFSSNKEASKEERLSYRSMLNILIQLRKICNHPDQLKSRDAQIPIEFNINTLQLPYLFQISDKLKHNFDNRNLTNKINNSGKSFLEVCSKRKRTERLIVDKRIKKRRVDLNSQLSFLSLNNLVSSTFDDNKEVLNQNFVTDVDLEKPNNYNHYNGYGINSEKLKSEPQNNSEVTKRNMINKLSREQLLQGQKINLGPMNDNFKARKLTVNQNPSDELSNKMLSQKLLNRQDNILNLNLKNNLEINKIIESYLILILNFLLISVKVVSKPVKLYFSGTQGINYNNKNDWYMNEVKTKLLKRDDKKYYKENKVTVEAVNSNYKLLFPSRRSINDDCGKFKVLGPLLLKLKSEDHRCIIYTQFSKMLDILENWINFMGFTYIRLDGSTKIDMRQKIINRFNENTKIFLFISSTRTGGVGITLTGADTVIFYDTDWNPAIDRQAMDRCHRIGQTKDVNVYRLITEHTVEENIWRKQLQKRKLDDLIVDQGQFDVQHNNWFSNLDTLINIFQNKRDEQDEEDIYGKKILHESNVDETQFQTKGVQNIKMLIEVEDADDSMALKKLKKENENINKQDFETDLINSIPGLVTYCIQFLLKYQTVTLERQVENMKLKIQIEDYQNQQNNEQEEDEDDIYTDYTSSENEELSQEDELSEDSQ
ncbi:DEAD-box family helicase, putative [Theileria annulata]|uniref:DEAD-box family helicase, putative n=1 Tax=Theileria annulata TaxID=5874 RepID=Q4UIX6_THEAN|nr:DEAD-box family helicase, putative [Theileria annulata]CAI72963.1 DEAD-box family helicase, putative [Theileria annulata]|eukprot:XP_953641.1 DEAD-box family helicase, putative [Theileria annulata]